MSISRQDVEKVALLARLQLTEAELATMTEQLAQIVGYVDQLAEVDTEGVEPMAHAIEVTNVFRDDEVDGEPAARRSAGQRPAPRRARLSGAGRAGRIDRSRDSCCDAHVCLLHETRLANSLRPTPVTCRGRAIRYRAFEISTRVRYLDRATRRISIASRRRSRRRVSARRCRTGARAGGGDRCPAREAASRWARWPACRSR